MLARVARVVIAVLLVALGGGVTYLALSIPNDLQAEKVLKQAKADVEAGQRGRARESLQRVVQQYPRTDAAAAALHMLFRMAEQDQAQLEKELIALKRQREGDRKKLDSLQRQLSATADKTSKAIEDAEAARKLAAARPTPVQRKAAVKKASSRKTPAKRPARRKRR